VKLSSKPAETLKYVEATTILILSVAFIYTRLSAIYRSSTGFDFADSPSYFIFSLQEPVRMPLITFIFSQVQYFGGITLIQVALSSIAWIFLAFSIYLFAPRFKFFGFVLIISLGLTSPIVELDTLILSESFTVSFLIAAISSLILFLKYKSFFWLFIHIVFIVLFSQIKQSNLYLGFAWIVIFSILIFIYEFDKSTKIKLAILLFPIFSIYFITLQIVGENSLHNRQLSNTLIIEKSFFTEELRDYWFSQGFPPQAFLTYSGMPFGIPIEMVRELITIKAWEKNTESNPSYRLLKDRPQYAIIAPVYPAYFIKNYGYLNSILPSLASGTQYAKNQAFRDGRYPSEKLPWMENWNMPTFFWWSDEFMSQKFILFILYTNILIFSIFSLYKKRQIGISAIFLLIFFLWLHAAIWGNWLTAPYRYERYLAPYAIGLRALSVAVLMLNLLLVQEYVRSLLARRSIKAT
jgi:hypothetical protein